MTVVMLNAVKHLHWEPLGYGENRPFTAFRVTEREKVSSPWQGERMKERVGASIGRGFTLIPAFSPREREYGSL